MTRFGVGPTFVLISAVLTAAALYVRSLDPAFFSMADVVPRWFQVGLGGLLLAFGLPMFVWSLLILNRGFPEGRLFTGGPYGWCRHPIYGCWVVFNVPGIVLLVGTWVGLLVPVLMYVTLRVLVLKEERWLLDTFGDEYKAYRARTPAVLPRLWGSGGKP
jgi:protein-S-isoprenylcysteine O-methyltransferase Ste14